MIEISVIDSLKRKFNRLRAEWDDRGCGCWAASEALELGHGGIKAVAQATGLGERTVRRGCEQVRQQELPSGPGGRRMRQPGGGRKPVTACDPNLVAALEAVVEPTTRGDPMSPWRWTCKSTRKLANALPEQGPKVSPTTVAHVVGEGDYSLPSTRQSLEGTSHPERDAQFGYINRWVKVFQRAGQPVISVEAKKKEWVGPFANRGREYQAKGQPERVRTHDFADKELGKVCPDGVYDLTDNRGWVSVGIDPDTAQCAVESSRRCWHPMGTACYPHAHAVLITADGGGSNASRTRL